MLDRKFKFQDNETIELPMKYVREVLGIGCPYCEIPSDDGFFLDLYSEEGKEVYINPFNKELVIDGDEYCSFIIDHCPFCGRELLEYY